MKKDFITVTPDNGNSDRTVTVQASGNSGDNRNSTITISGGSMSRTITINQEGKPICTLSFKNRASLPIVYERLISDKPVASTITVYRKTVNNSTSVVESSETFTIANGGTESKESQKVFLQSGFHYEYSLNTQEDSTYRYVLDM